MNHKKPELKEKMKERLYPVVLGQFSSKDFHEVNIRDISSESGISTGTIYKYFTSKEDLLFSIIDEKLVQLGDLLRLHIKGLENTREIFRKVFWVTMDFFDMNPELAITSFITVPLKKWMESDAYLRETEIDILRAIVDSARKRGDLAGNIKDRYYADLYFMICSRHIHNWYFHGRRWKLAETIDDFFNFFWEIVRPIENNGGGKENE